MDIRMESKIEGEGLSLEGGIPPSSEGRKMMQMQVHLLRMREFLSMSQGPTVGVGDIAIVTFGKCNLPQRFKMRHGIGEQKVHHQPEVFGT